MTEPQMGIDETELAALTTDDERWKRVDKQFQALNLRQSTQDVAIAGLAEQGSATNEKLDMLLEKTSTMVDAWDDGVQIKKVFCRLAKAWDFMLKKMLLPLIGTIAVLAILRAIFAHEAIPEWAVGLFKSFLG